jgi:hypothetical protein
MGIIDPNITEQPDGLYVGLGAMTVQSYVEANVKNGTQFEGSVLLSMAGTSTNDTIFKTGSKPVILKTREISYSGDGLSTFIFEDATYTGGTSAVYQNANAIDPAVGTVDIIVGTTITDDGELIFAPIHYVGNVSNQGKGGSANTIGSERLLKPNTTYMLRIVSLDAQTQEVTSFLYWYEGNPDITGNTNT